MFYIDIVTGQNEINQLRKNKLKNTLSRLNRKPNEKQKKKLFTFKNIIIFYAHLIYN